jgi:hypothetical protein
VVEKNFNSSHVLFDLFARFIFPLGNLIASFLALLVALHPKSFGKTWWWWGLEIVVENNQPRSDTT